MSVYLYFSDDRFPNPLEENDEIVAVGGNLSLKRLIHAYKNGIFPWYDKDTPILWWFTYPRLILDVNKLHVSKRLARLIRQKRFKVTLNFDFAKVINMCAYVNKRRDGDTWLLPEMIEAYVGLHEIGYAHSVEAWDGKELVGGLYGVAIGKAFFGESMFYIKSNASKVAFVHLVHYLRKKGFWFIDCQQTTEHMKRFGAFEISKKAFYNKLQEAIKHPTPIEIWAPKELTVE